MEWSILNAVSVAVRGLAASPKIELEAQIHFANVKILLDFFGFGRYDMVRDTPDIIFFSVALLMWIR